jgi:hypothetical protein
MVGLKILSSTSLLVPSTLPTRHQPSCRLQQNQHTKRLALTQPHSLELGQSVCSGGGVRAFYPGVKVDNVDYLPAAAW